MGLGADVREGLCVLGVVWRCIIRLCGHKYLSLCFQTPRRKEHVTAFFCMCVCTCPCGQHSSGDHEAVSLAIFSVYL